MQPAENILSVNKLDITFSGKEAFTAVKEISFELAKGETLAIVGESGSGKSLTALSLIGLLPKTAVQKGNITLSVAGKNYQLSHTDEHTMRQLRGCDIGMVFQEPMSALNPVMKIGRQLSECILAHNNISKAEAKRTAIEWLGKVQLPVPETLYERFPHQLSGGQKQRVMIAMAMCNHPVLLLADEPTTALDVTVQQEVIRLMSYLQEQHNTAMVFITHDLSLAATIADKILVMYKGEAIEYGAAKDVLNNPQQPYTKALLACRPSAQQKGYRLPVVADYLDNPNGVVVPEKGSVIKVGTENILEVNDLRVWFPVERNLLGVTKQYFKAVDGVSFDIKKGEVLGLVGESGCGKSTVSRALMGLLPVHSGNILFEGKEVSQLTAQQWRQVRKDIQLIFQDPYASLNPRISIGDMLSEALRTHHIVPANAVRKEAERLMDLVQLPVSSLDRYPHQFSGGQRQRIGIARALALRPKMLICDESVSALDVSIQAQILNLLKDLQNEFQLTYLFISHDLSVVHYISDRVMVMQLGKIVEAGLAEQVLKHPEHAYTRKLIDAMP